MKKRKAIESDENVTMDRRLLLRRGAKAVYVAPAVLAAVKAGERQALAQSGPGPLQP